MKNSFRQLLRPKFCLAISVMALLVYFFLLRGNSKWAFFYAEPYTAATIVASLPFYPHSDKIPEYIFRNQPLYPLTLPLYGVATWFFYLLSGDVIESVFILGVLTGFLFLLLLYLLGTSWFGRRVGYLAVLLTVTSGWTILCFRISQFWIFLSLVCTALTMWLTREWINRKDYRYLTGIFLTLGLTLCGSSWYASFLPLAILAICLWDGQEDLLFSLETVKSFLKAFSLCLVLLLGWFFVVKGIQKSRDSSVDPTTTILYFLNKVRVGIGEAHGAAKVDFREAGRLARSMFWEGSFLLGASHQRLDRADGPWIAFVVTIFFLFGLLRSSWSRGREDKILICYAVLPFAESIFLGFQGRYFVFFIIPCMIIAAREIVWVYERISRTWRKGVFAGIIFVGFAIGSLETYVSCNVANFSLGSNIDQVLLLARRVGNDQDLSHLRFFLPPEWVELFHVATDFRFRGQVFRYPSMPATWQIAINEFMSYGRDNRIYILWNKDEYKKEGQPWFHEQFPRVVPFFRPMPFGDYMIDRSCFPDMYAFNRNFRTEGGWTVRAVTVSEGDARSVLTPDNPDREASIGFGFSVPSKTACHFWCQAVPLEAPQLLRVTVDSFEEVSVSLPQKHLQKYTDLPWVHLDSRTLDAGKHIMRLAAKKSKPQLQKCIVFSPSILARWPSKGEFSYREFSFDAADAGMFEFIPSGAKECRNIMRIRNGFFSTMSQESIIERLDRGVNTLDVGSDCFDAGHDGVFVRSFDSNVVLRPSRAVNLVAVRYQAGAWPHLEFVTPLIVRQGDFDNIINLPEANPTKTDAVASFPFQLSKSGIYHVFAQILTKEIRGVLSVRIDNSPWSQPISTSRMDQTESSIAWTRLATVNLPAGEHSLVVKVISGTGSHDIGEIVFASQASVSNIKPDSSGRFD